MVCLLFWPALEAQAAEREFAPGRQGRAQWAVFVREALPALAKPVAFAKRVMERAGQIAGLMAFVRWEQPGQSLPKKVTTKGYFPVACELARLLGHDLGGLDRQAPRGGSNIASAAGGAAEGPAASPQPRPKAKRARERAMSTPAPSPQSPAIANIPQLLFERAERLGERTAMRVKEFGLWNDISWTAYGQKARATAMGLAALGVGPGDIVAVIGENRPEWLYADMGAMAAGGVTTGIYTTNAAEECAYILGHSEAKVYIVEDEEQLDKALEVRDDCPNLAKIVVIDTEGLRHFQRPHGDQL